MRLSRFGQRYARGSGIGRLMEDLGQALAGRDRVCMLGGGNPAHIPEVQERLRDSMERLLRGGGGVFERAVGDYDPPQGNREFIEALADLFHGQLGWDVGPDNIALTNGSQTAFFILFNMLAGPCDDGVSRRILLPLTPEYIGYADIGLDEDFFETRKPLIEEVEPEIFKYRINFESLDVNETIGAICASRPTNPTGNVLTDEEVRRLRGLARSAGVPLIIDNAYGAPFPQVLFTETTLEWDPDTILCMSLSKFGLPALRTGIVVACPEIVHVVSEVNAVLGLAPTRMGAALAVDLVRSGEIITISRDIIRPFYQRKAAFALDCLRNELDGVNHRIHKPEGALFLWLWLPEFPVTTAELYERLKARGCLVVPGHYFFPGLREDWPHRHECLRITYAQDDDIVRTGLSLLGDEVRQLAARGRR